MSDQNTAVIVAYKRSPFHPANKGALTKIRPDDLAAQTLLKTIEHAGIKPEDIEDVLCGCAFPEAEQGFNIAKIITQIAKMPVSIGGATINRFCGSSMTSIQMAAGCIAHGSGDVFLCGGAESMTRIPMGGFNPQPNPALAKDFPAAYMNMGLTAENLAKEYKVSREAQDAFALNSHKKAAKAQQDGLFEEEIIEINGVNKDGCIRAESTLEGLQALNPAFDKEGSVTAGTSSPLTDGAAFTAVTSLDYAKKHNLPILAKIKSFAVAGCAAETMGIGPVPATQKAMERAGLNINDIDIIELNEAFAAQSLAVLKALDLDNDKAMERINLDGGAIALGHPLGASGARITGKAASLLQREGKEFALATMCIGGGQGTAVILEAVS